MNMLRAIFAGSFDPTTNGHLNLIERASTIFGQLEIVIAVNPQKKYFFSAEERLEMLRHLVKDYPNVGVHVWDRLIVEFAEKIGVHVLLRGVRAMADFEYEFELSMINRGLNQKIETIFMPTDPKYFVLRSSAIKEIAQLGGDISSMVPTIVADALKRKVRGS